MPDRRGAIPGDSARQDRNVRPRTHGERPRARWLQRGRVLTGPPDRDRPGSGTCRHSPALSRSRSRSHGNRRSRGRRRRSAGACGVTSLHRRAPGTGARRRASGHRQRRGHRGHLRSECGQSCDLCIDLREPAPEELFGGFAGADPRVPDRQQVSDVHEAQPEPLRTSDEPETVDGGGVVGPVAARGAVRGGQEPHPLVVADGVGPHPDGRSQFRHAQCSRNGGKHGEDARPWSRVQGQA